MTHSSGAGAIGVFDSGYGGLTILHEIRQQLPMYDYIYIGDNARAPYGSRSFDVVYEFTRQAVMKLFAQGCRLVILACNTASAKALRTIQQHDLPTTYPSRRVLGVIRPTAEVIGDITTTRHVGIVATPGTIKSRSYEMEIGKLYPDIIVTGQACPLWAAIVEANEADSKGADYFVKKRLDELMSKDPHIDSLILGCTHYPLLLSKIRKHLPASVHIIPQGCYVARSLDDYLHRHPEIASRCTQGGTCRYLTTESPERFQETARMFLHEDVQVEHISLE
ncbi:glutamate racemase [Hoylesella marshii]|uniref:Glutamate racemase n=1 Tax=Hoylesella marshii DSM 16973 = JCM 13450 TaxID=862515 RepID=E0NVH5_9BACT|nr:glutamate racemase [Hoylesella marshii]EFM00909.1 glutamate racemase [Hoylesella marshii DSM 16973 = JCM 13450]